jgi:hypothetical protein
LVLQVEKGLSRSDVRAIRHALRLKSPEVMIDVRFVNRRHTRVEVTTNHGSKCLSYGSIYTFSRTKSGWEWLRNLGGGVNY